MGTFIKRLVVVTLCSSAIGSSSAFCEDAQTKKDPAKFSWGGFVDTYYAYDSNNPLNRDRPIVTQAKRNNEFNVNLAYLEANLNSDRVRGRLALQTGTSVMANYSGEPTQGVVSGPSLSQLIQEGVVGYQVFDRFWIDAGIYFAPIGAESFISKYNWNYTRSLEAELTPYYQSGVRATYQWDDHLTTQFHVLNGWSNISENNNNKAMELQIAYTPNSVYSVTYTGFLGNEVSNLSRSLNQAVVKVSLSQAFQLAATYSLGLQARPDGSGNSVWQSANLLGHCQFSSIFAIGLRTEIYSDKDQVIVSTLTPNGFFAWGGSINLDVSPIENLIWRTELRQLWTQDPVFPTQDLANPSRSDTLVVTSLALSFEGPSGK